MPTSSGPITLPADPTAPAHASTKQYVDQTVAGAAAPPNATSTTKGVSRLMGGTADAPTVPARSVVAAAARKYKTGNQTNTGSAAVTLAAIDYNRNTAVFDMSGANAIKVLVPGVYLFACTIYYTGGDAGFRNGFVQVNGTTVRDFGAPGNTTEVRLGFTDALVLAANDSVVLNSYATAAATAPTINGTALKDTGMSLTLLGS